MKLLINFFIFSMALSLALASCQSTKPQPASCQSTKPQPISRCPPCNPKAGCRIWRCPCTHDGFTMYPGNEPLNAPRPAGCPKCPDSVCDNLAIRCVYPYLQCDANQVATYKCIEKIEIEEVQRATEIDNAIPA